MGLKPAKQGSHLTRTPIFIKHWNQQHLPQGGRGEAARPLAGVLGALPPRFAGSKKMLWRISLLD